MDKDVNSCENNLKTLCVEMIKLLGELKDNGLLNEKEYNENIAEKKRFLKDFL